MERCAEAGNHRTSVSGTLQSGASGGNCDGAAEDRAGGADYRGAD